MGIKFQFSDEFLCYPYLRFLFFKRVRFARRKPSFVSCMFSVGMDGSVDIEHTLVDLDEDIEILLGDLNTDDLVLTEHELAEIIEHEEYELASIPPLTFIDDQESNQISDKAAVSIPTRSSPRKQASCGICGTTYKKPKVLAKHYEICRQKADAKLAKTTYPLSEEDFKESFSSFLEKSISDARGSKVLSLNSKIKDILSHLEPDTVDLSELSAELSIEFYNVVKKKANSAAEREALQTNFHNMALNSRYLQIWNSFLRAASIASCKESTMLFQHILDRLLFHSLKHRTDVMLTEKEPVSDAELKLSTVEEETLRYVAGYIPFSLKRKYHKQRHLPEGKAILAVLASWSTEKADVELSFLDYTRNWTAEKNRGGLFVINDEMYIFIRRVENVARTLFNKRILVQYCNQNLNKELVERLSDSHLVTLGWDAITRQLENKSLAEKLKQEVFTKWVNIRATSFLKAWLALQRLKVSEEQQKKKKSKSAISAKSAPSLRKSLSSSLSSSQK